MDGSLRRKPCRDTVVAMTGQSSTRTTDQNGRNPIICRAWVVSVGGGPGLWAVAVQMDDDDGQQRCGVDAATWRRRLPDVPCMLLLLLLLLMLI